MRLRSPSVLSRWGLWRVVDGWRERIRQAAVATLSGSALGIYLGIIVGEPGYLTQELRDAFMTTGTVHILSISGSHLGLIAFLSFFLMKGACHQLPDSWLQTLSRRVTPTRLAAATTTIPVAFYTLLAGSEVATVRSLVMIVLFLLAVWLGRAQQLLLAIASAALLIVVHDPRALFDISFQLSFCSVLAIALVVRWKVDESERDVRRPASFGSRAGAWLRGYAWVTGGVTLATMPLVAHHFNQIAWLGLAANLVVVPLAGFVLVPLGLASAVGVLLSGWNELPGGLLNQVGLDLMSNMVHLLARIPGAEWHIASPAILSMAGFYGLLYVTIRSEENRLLRWTSVAVIVLLLAWWAWSPHRAPDDGALFVTFLDVGQGDASLIELPDGRTVLIDGGATYETLDMGRAVVGPYLWNRGIAHLDYVIGTHPQLDHVGGLAWVLRSFGVGQYWGNGIGRAETFYRRLRGTLVDRSLHERVAQEGQAILDSGPCRLLVLNPPREEGIQNERRVESGTLLNNLSVVTRLDCGLHSFLFPADIEAEALARLRESDASAGIGVVKVPHHGARGSLDAQWIDRVDAQVAVISVGSHNPYGHPAAEVLAAYEERGVKLYRTDRDGAILVTARANSPDIKVRAARELRPQPVRLNQSMSGLFASERRNLVCLWMQWVGLWDC
jgi:competence protein ComEC